jgi:hypothetical protein
MKRTGPRLLQARLFIPTCQPLFMRRDLLIIAVVVLVAVAAIAIAYPLFYGVASADILSVSTDKELYHSNEVMHISVDVTSSGKMENTTLFISGIEDRYGDSRLMQTLPANLSPGTNRLSYDYQLPPCSHCAGLDPGDYQFNVTLERDGLVLDETNYTIRIEQ